MGERALVMEPDALNELLSWSHGEYLTPGETREVYDSHEALRAALSFYADSRHWEPGSSVLNAHQSAVDCDFGERARAVLAGVRSDG